MAKIIPFPALRRSGFVQRQAMRMAREAPRGAENWLAHILAINRHAMAQKGVAVDLMQAELRALESAIRAHLWYLVVRGDGAA